MTPRGKTTAPLIDRLTARRSRLPHPTAWEKETVRIPLRDGERLAADVYTPTVRSKGVLLVRTPYGRSTGSGSPSPAAGSPSTHAIPVPGRIR